MKRNYFLAFGILLCGITYLLAQDGIIFDPIRLLMYGIGVILMIVGLVKVRKE